MPLTGASTVIRKLNDDILSAARSDAKILITGESGVGKEIVAREIHGASRRKDAPMVALNCAGVPDTLLESELFGHERGSFTGAYRDQPGVLQASHGGTIFLDEVGEMSLRMQALMLRFLECGEVQRVGSTGRNGRVDVRVIAATNRDLHERMTAREFREDLYYRINVIAIRVPPLRDRREDVPLLIDELVREYTRANQVPAPVLAAEVVERLAGYDWPGNVRQLRNVLERLACRGQRRPIAVHDLPAEILEGAGHGAPAAAPRSPAPRKADVLYARITAGGESFWEVVYPSFMARDLARDDLRAIVARGLEATRGNYRGVVDAFHMEPASYKRFLNFLRKHDCLLPFEPFRQLHRPGAGAPAPGPDPSPGRWARFRSDPFSASLPK